MKTLLQTVFLITLTMFCGIGVARNTVETKAWVVGTHMSQEGETREQFVMRVASIMQVWTDENDAEVCGYIATNGKQWGIILTTQRSQIMCVMDKNMVPKGFVADKDSIHTHPNPNPRGVVEVSQATIDAAAAIGETGLRRKIEISHGFSGSDKRNGPGYLVAGGRIMHWDGRRQRSIGAVGSN